MVNLIRNSIDSIKSNPVSFCISLSSEVSSFAQSCLSRFSERVTSDGSYSLQWERFKQRCSTHFESASSVIAKVSQVFSRLMSICSNELHEVYLYSFKPQYHRDSALETVAANGLNLRFCSSGSKNNPLVVLAAISKNVEALAYASDALKGDREFILAAVDRNPLAIRYACDELKVDDHVIRAAISTLSDQERPAVFAELFRDKQWVIAFMAKEPAAFAHLPEELRRDKQVVLAAVNQNGRALEYASEELQEDVDVVVAAVTQNRGLLDCIPEELKWNKRVVLALMDSNPRILRGCARIFARG